jgi:hypothetical protein
VLKRVGVLIIVMNCVLLSAFVGGCTDCKNMHGMNNIKNGNFLFQLHSRRVIMIQLCVIICYDL